MSIVPMNDHRRFFDFCVSSSISLMFINFHCRHFHGYETGHRVDAEVQLLGNLPFLETARLPAKPSWGFFLERSNW